MNSFFKYLILFIVWFVVSVLGAIFFFVNAYVSDQGTEIEWSSLEAPPEKAVNVIAPYYIETVTGKFFYHNSFQCPIDCWQEVEKVEYDSEYLLSVSDCGWYPDTKTYISSLAICERWGPGFYKKVWAIDEQGNVWFWEKAMGENGAIMVFISPFLGFFFTLFLSGIIITCFIFVDGLITSIKLKKGASSIFEKVPLAISSLFLIIAPLLVFLYLIINLNEENSSSFMILFFCINPLPLLGTIAGIVAKNRTKIILGLFTMLLMALVWLRLFQVTEWLK